MTTTERSHDDDSYDELEERLRDIDPDEDQKVIWAFSCDKEYSSGNIFTSGPGGLLVISSEGKLLAKMNLKHITNCTFDNLSSKVCVCIYILKKQFLEILETM